MRSSAASTAAVVARRSASFDCNFGRQQCAHAYGAVSEKCATMTRAQRRDNGLSGPAVRSLRSHLVLVRCMCVWWWPLALPLLLLLVSADTCAGVDVVTTCYAECGSRLVSCLSSGASLLAPTLLEAIDQ